MGEVENCLAASFTPRNRDGMSYGVSPRCVIIIDGWREGQKQFQSLHFLHSPFFPSRGLEETFLFVSRVLCE